jgi:hypothetical protein
MWRVGAAGLGVMRSSLPIKLDSQAIADQLDHFDPVGVVDPAFMLDDHFPSIAIGSYRNYDIGGVIRRFLPSPSGSGLQDAFSNTVVAKRSKLRRLER